MPFAGRVTLCAFDKTGTLTSDVMEVAGLVGMKKSKNEKGEEKGERRIEGVGGLYRLSAPPLSSSTTSFSTPTTTTTSSSSSTSTTSSSSTTTTTTPGAGATATYVPSTADSYLCTMVMGGCHSLCSIDGTLVGDPMERAAFSFAGWGSLLGDVAIAKTETGRTDRLHIYRRFAFSSELQRSSVIVKHEGGGPAGGGGGRGAVGSALTGGGSGAGDDAAAASSSASAVWVLSKGSPERMREFLIDVEEQEYTRTYEEWSRRGFRVLCLAGKPLQKSQADIWNKLERSQVEAHLRFGGLLILGCQLKHQTAQCVRQLEEAGQATIMITGDNPLTACQVAEEVQIGGRGGGRRGGGGGFLILQEEGEGGEERGGVGEEEEEVLLLSWKRRDGGGSIPYYKAAGRASKECHHPTRLSQSHVLCVTGPALARLSPPESNALIPYVSVFARVNPQQKELIIRALNRAKRYTLMCGDGTNDVGALKAAHVGVSLLSSMPKEAGTGAGGGGAGAGGGMAARRTAVGAARKGSGSQQASSSSWAAARAAAAASRSSHHHRRRDLRAQLEALEEQASAPTAKLGEASIASPFTYKGDTIRCVHSILRCGRATLATVVMMYKLMALNSLVTAFALSVLTLDGVKLGDVQTSVEGLFATVLHLMLSKARPARKLSRVEPEHSVFGWSVILSLCGQAAVHFITLIVGWRMATRYRPWAFETDIDGPFTPNIVNTVVFYLLASMQASSFLSNYEGAPFMTPLRENRSLLTVLAVFVLLLFAGVLEVCPEVNEMLSLVPAPDEAFRWKLLGLVGADVGLSWLWARGVAGLRVYMEENKLRRKLEERGGAEGEKGGGGGR